MGSVEWMKLSPEEATERACAVARLCVDGFGQDADDEAILKMLAKIPVIEGHDVDAVRAAIAAAREALKKHPK